MILSPHKRSYSVHEVQSIDAFKNKHAMIMMMLDA
jgi:hypothetical protein